MSGREINDYAEFTPPCAEPVQEMIASVINPLYKPAPIW